MPPAHSIKECRPNEAGKLVVFDVTYYEYICKGVQRRVSHAVPTDEPCDDNAYRTDAQMAREKWGEQWPYRGVTPPPPPPPAVACTATPQGRIRPVYVSDDPRTPGYTAAIWMDEKGNMFTAIYYSDGTSVWEAAGTIPPRPSKGDVTKSEWQFTPDALKQMQNSIKELEKALEDPAGVRSILGGSSGTGTLSPDEFRQYVNKLLAWPADNCVIPQETKTPEKTIKSELPKSNKRPRKG